MKRAVFPGSFDPLTVAHLAIADGAQAQLSLDLVCMVISREPLAKRSEEQASVEERLAAIETVAVAGRSWLTCAVTDDRLLADIARGYDFVIVGADKAAQLQDPSFYGGSEMERDAALARLPALVVAPRPAGVIPEEAIVLDLPGWVAGVSSTAVRAGRIEWKA
ncbi:MAG: hypothetical protein KY395_08060 [Actinobacteria bacterium]|nr:hypothetical protein [Actinomycetota bacterium]